MRLIDADSLYDILADKLTWLMGYGDETYLAVGNDIKNTIEEQSTAYSVENIVAELEKKKQNALEVEESIKEYNIWNNAIEIVKLHGKEGNEKYHDRDFDEKER